MTGIRSAESRIVSPARSQNADYGLRNGERGRERRRLLPGVYPDGDPHFQGRLDGRLRGCAGQGLQSPGPGRGESRAEGTGEGGRQGPGQSRLGGGRRGGWEEGPEDAFGGGSEEALGGHPGGGGPRKSR